MGNEAKLNELPEKLKADPLKLHTNSKVSIPVFLPGLCAQ
jgi:hypothetical protein